MKNDKMFYLISMIVIFALGFLLCDKINNKGRYTSIDTFIILDTKTGDLYIPSVEDRNSYTRFNPVKGEREYFVGKTIKRSH